MAKIKRKLYKGLPLVDSNMDLEIEVIKSDVSKASKKNPAKCAAANAVSRVLKTDVEVHLSRTYIKDKDNKRWIRFMTPNSISREIVSFDRSSIFEPGIYTLKAPSQAQKLGHYRG